jgi:hypothetical protein
MSNPLRTFHFSHLFDRQDEAVRQIRDFLRENMTHITAGIQSKAGQKQLESPLRLVRTTVYVLT